MRCSTHSAAPASVQCATRPCRLRALARACRASRLLIGLVLELVIGFETVRSHGGVASFDMGRQVDGNGRRLVALLAAVFERQAYGVGVRYAAVERLPDGGIEFGGAIAVEQPQQGRRDSTEIVAALGGAQQQGLACRRRHCEAVGPAMTAGGALVVDECL